MRRSQAVSLEGDWLPQFRGSAPYIAMFRGSNMVFHIPAHLLDRAAAADLEGLLGDIMLCALLGVRPVLVLSLDQRIAARRAAGVNTSDSSSDDAVRVVKQEAGLACDEIENVLRRLARSVAMAGSRSAESLERSVSVYASTQLVSARRAARDSELGVVTDIDVAQIQRRLDDGSIVCVTPLGMSGSEALYVQSQELAAAIAKQLKATKLIFFTRGQRIQEIIHYLALLVDGLRGGTRRGHLIDPIKGALLQELYTSDGSGTLVSQDLYDGIRPAAPSDVAGILSLIEPLAQRGLLRRRSGYEVERACQNSEFAVWKRDDTTIGCAHLMHFEDAPAMAELGCFVVSPRSRGKGHGLVLLSYMERMAQLKGINTLFLLTTQTMQWFVEHGFREASVSDLPPCKQLKYDVSRSSKVYIKDLTELPSALRDRFAFVEVDTLD